MNNIAAAVPKLILVTLLILSGNELTGYAPKLDFIANTPPKANKNIPQI